MLHTAEIRWFLAGSLPLQAIQWFCAGLPLSPEERVDRYLVFPGCETAGVKIRQGIFEIKVRKGAAEALHFPSDVSGRAECWVKWSYSQPAAQPWVYALLAEQQGWIQVKKSRWLRTFSLDGKPIVEALRGERFREGCQVELARLVALNREWWSVALEAFGEPGRVRDNLRTAGAHFFAHYPPPERLSTVGSCSYPAWLAGL